MRFMIVGLFAGATAFALSLGAGCGDDTGVGGDDDEENPETADVVYQAGATDEALDSLLAVSATPSATEGASFTFPLADATVPSATAPTFTWAVGAHSGRFAPPTTIDGLFPPTAPARAAAPSHPALALLQGFLSGERSAHAHGTPTSGPAFFVVFSTSKSDKLLRVFTTATTYTPDADALAKMKGAGEAIHAVITNAQFDQNRIAQDGGPYSGTAIAFTVE